MSKISVVIPTYNESQNIVILMERLNQVLSGFDKEVILVDDNSPDKTWEIAKNLSQTYPWLRVIRRVHDKGLSSAVLAGFSISEGDFLVVMDADLQHDESVLPRLILELEKGAHIVVGSRKSEGGSIENWPLFRKIASSTAALLSRIALKHSVSDPMSGFFALRKEVYSSCQNELNPRGFKILLEFLARSKWAHIVEVGYTFRGRVYGESKLTSSVVFEYVRALYDLSLGSYLPFRFLKYVLVGFSGLIVSYLSLIMCLNILNLTNSRALAVSIELSIVTNFIFNNYWTFQEKKLTGFWKITRGLFTFQAICLSGALINQSIALKLLEHFDINLYLSNAIGYILAAIWNYTINVGVTWKTLS